MKITAFIILAARQMCILYLLGLVPLNLETFTSLACRAALAHEGKVLSGKIVFVSCSEQQQVCPNPSIGTIRQGAQRLSTQHATRTPGKLAKIWFFRRLIKPRCFSHNVALCKHRKQPRPHSLIDWFYPPPPARRSGAPQPRCLLVQTNILTGDSYS